MGYGAKIWGWKEKKEIEKIHERFLKWMLGINWKTVGYLCKVREVERQMMKGRVGKRAQDYEKILHEESKGVLAEKCLKEMKEKRKDNRQIGTRKKRIFQKKR